MLTPDCTLDVKPYRIDVPQQDIDDLHTALRVGRITRSLWENSGDSSQTKGLDYGVKREWLIRARDAWLQYDWYVSHHFADWALTMEESRRKEAQ